MTIMLLPAPADPATPDVIGWRVGPGLVRVDTEVDADDLPTELRELADTGVLRSVRVRPGRIDTRLMAGHDATSDGSRIRAALFGVLSKPGGWPSPTHHDDGPATSPERAVRRGADHELEIGVREVLAGEFGVYTASHGGHVDLVDVTDGTVTVRLTGQCHGCAAAEVTLRDNLAQRLRRLPGYVGLRTATADGCPDRPRGTTFLGRLPGFRSR